MQLTRFTDLGLRVLMYLTQKGSDRVVTVAEIATVFQVSNNHLIKVVHFMAQQGWLKTTRGKGGGLALAQAPEWYSIGQIVRQLEPSLDLVNCAEPPCVLVAGCLLKQALNQAMQAFLVVLDGYSLADMVQQSTGAALSEVYRLFILPDPL